MSQPDISRRDFLKAMGGVVGLSFLASCGSGPSDVLTKLEMQAQGEELTDNFKNRLGLPQVSQEVKDFLGAPLKAAGSGEIELRILSGDGRFQSYDRESFKYRGYDPGVDFGPFFNVTDDRLEMELRLYDEPAPESQDEKIGRLAHELALASRYLSIFRGLKAAGLTGDLLKRKMIDAVSGTERPDIYELHATFMELWFASDLYQAGLFEPMANNGRYNPPNGPKMIEAALWMRDNGFDFNNHQTEFKWLWERRWHAYQQAYYGETGIKLTVVNDELDSTFVQAGREEGWLPENLFQPGQ